MFAVIAMSALAVVACKNGNKGQEGEQAAEEAVEQCTGDCQNCKACEQAAEEIGGIEKLQGIEGVAETEAAGLAESLKNNGIFSVAEVEVKPSFNGGGAEEFLKWIASNLNYPESAKENNEQGKVYVSFNVNKEGQICDVKVVKGVSEAIDAEALRVISEAPAWTPGTMNGNPVGVNYICPINFTLK